MKPQREGGGNNIYGKDIPPFLAKLSDKEKEGYILMDLIRPEVQDSTIVRDGKAEDFKVISELGIYGIYLRYVHHFFFFFPCFFFFLKKKNYNFKSIHNNYNSNNLK